MSLHHRPVVVAEPTPCCWVQTGNRADGPMCRDHARTVREMATAQAQPGYRAQAPVDTSRAAA